MGYQLGFDWYHRAMKVTMDRVGRVVVPKPVRDELGLSEHSEFDLVIDGVAIRLEPRQVATREIIESGDWPTLAAVEGVVLTDEDVRRIRDVDRP